MKSKPSETFQWGRIATLARKLQGEVTPSNRAYCSFLAVQLTLLDAPESARPRLERALQESVVESLKEHLTFLADSRSGTALPKDIANLLISGFLDLLSGETNSIFMPARPSGGKSNKRSRHRQRQIDHAINYLTGVELGLVSDQQSRQTVATRYGVTPQTVARWLAKAGSIGERETQAKKAWSVAWERQPERIERLLTKTMMSCGKEYRRG